MVYYCLTPAPPKYSNRMSLGHVSLVSIPMEGEMSAFNLRLLSTNNREVGTPAIAHAEPMGWLYREMRCLPNGWRHSRCWNLERKYTHKVLGELGDSGSICGGKWTRGDSHRDGAEGRWLVRGGGGEEGEVRGRESILGECQLVLAPSLGGTRWKM